MEWAIEDMTNSLSWLWVISMDEYSSFIIVMSREKWGIEAENVLSIYMLCDQLFGHLLPQYSSEKFPYLCIT